MRSILVLLGLVVSVSALQPEAEEDTAHYAFQYTEYYDTECRYDKDTGFVYVTGVCTVTNVMVDQSVISQVLMRRAFVRLFGRGRWVERTHSICAHRVVSCR